MSKQSPIILSFKPKEATSLLLDVLSDRARDIVVKRYGLGGKASRETLETIGKEYNITRERVRQIENFALRTIKKSPVYGEFGHYFDELKTLMESYGGIVHERSFLESVVKDKSGQNHIHFLLVVAEAFIKIKEDNDFHHRWTVNPDMAERVQQSIRNLCSDFSRDDLVAEDVVVEKLIGELRDVLETAGNRQMDLARNLLAISKQLTRNPLGEWGLADSPNVKMRGIRDYAYLVLRHHGSPMHFREVAKRINELFGRKAHSATCHNELIKDERFVLVGRGLYALTEWGYSQGVVLDVVKNILLRHGPLTKEEIIKQVLKERYVKENTILVNLQNDQIFGRNEFGQYFVVK